MKIISNFFKNKRILYGGASSILIAFSIIIAILLNLIMQNFNIQFDLTENRIYTLSSQTKTALSNIQYPVTIYTLSPLGQEINMISMIANQYNQFDNINVINQDPFLNPAFLAQFSPNISENYLIVRSHIRYIVIPSTDLFDGIHINPINFTIEANYFIAEPAITNAVLYVLAEHRANIFEISLHQNAKLPPDFINMLLSNGYTHQNINLMVESIPYYADILIFSTPTIDISPIEANAIINFLENGGLAFFALDWIPYEFENIMFLINSFGIEPVGGFINEIPGRHAANNPPFVMHPVINNHIINSTISEPERFLLLIAPKGIQTVEFLPQNYSFYPLLSSTGGSFLRNNPELTSQNITEYDKEGPFTIAAAIAHNSYRIVAIGSSSIFDEEINRAVVGSNSEFFINSLNWLLGYNESEFQNLYINIPPTPILNNNFLNISQSQNNILQIFSMVGMPSIILTLGVVIWIKRKNK